MPRPLNPANIANGGGLAAKRSIEATSFVNPTQGLDGLGAHINDPSQAHMAATIGIVDAGHYYVSDEVEGALQEIAATGGYSFQNGVYRGCGYTVVGLSLTIDANSYVIVNGTGRDMSGESITLVDNAINWLYVNGTTGVLSSVTGSTPPSFTTPENLLLWRIVYSGGSIVSSRDARWFVRNLNRKLPLIVRISGTEADANSEASFESLDAAMLYLENFGGSALRTYTVVIKGPLTLDDTVIIPVDGVTLQGEDGCVLSTGANNLAPLINISGRSNIKIQDITFSCDHTGCTGIGISSPGALSGVWIERCAILSGSQDWNQGVAFSISGPHENIYMRDCVVECDTYGVRVREPQNSRFENVSIVDTGTGVNAFLLGLSGGALNNTSNVRVTNCVINGFTESIYLRGLDMTVEGTTIVDCVDAINVDVDSSFVVLANNGIQNSTTTGVSGILISGSIVTVDNCVIANQRAGGTYTVEVPVGIDVALSCNQITISDCQIAGYLNTTTPGGDAIRFAGASDSSIVQGCVMDSCAIGVEVLTASDRFRVANCAINNTSTGLVLHDGAIVTGTTIRLDSSIGLIGIDVVGDDVQIDNCRIDNPRLASSYGALVVPMGIRLNNTGPNHIHNTRISGFYNSVGSLGALIGADGGANSTIISGVVGSSAQVGFDLTGGTSSTITDSVLVSVGTGIIVDGGTNTIANTTVEVSSTYGEVGIYASAPTTVTNCNLNCGRTVWSGEIPIGIGLADTEMSILGCHLTGWSNTTDSLGAGVFCAAGSSEVIISENSIQECWYGVYSPSASAASLISVSGNDVFGCDYRSIYLQNADQVKISGNVISGMAAGSAQAIYVGYSTDVEITDNRINGNSETQYGIMLEGTDVAANRLRRFVVANNNIRAITIAGIFASGYVQNGAIAANHIDGQLASGDPTSVACIYLASSGSALPKYITVSDNTCWRSQSGVLVVGSSAANSCTDISVTGNVIHHCALGSVGTDPCYGVSLTLVAESIVSNNTIYQIGQLISNNDVVSDPASGGDVYPIGINLDSVSSVVVSGNSITDCVAVGTGTSRAILLTATGTVDPVESQGVNIIGNHILTNTGIVPHSYGIAVSYGQAIAPGDTSTLYGLNISNNTIRFTDFGAISLVLSGGVDAAALSICNNTLTKTLAGQGIYLLLQTSAVYSPPFLRGLHISDNNLSGTSSNAVQIQTQDGCSLSDVHVESNTLRDISGYGIRFVAGAAPAELANLVFANNIITDTNNDAVSVSITDYAETYGLSVVGNTITGTGGIATATTGVSITTVATGIAASNLNSLRVSDNTIHSGARGLDVAVDGFVLGAVITENEITSVTEGSYVVLANTPVAQTYSRDIVFSNNTLTNGTGAWLLLSGGGKLTGYTVQGNKLRGGSYGVLVSMENATVGTEDALTNIRVVGNTFTDMSFVTIGFLLGMSSGLQDPMSNFHIADNQFFRCNSSGMNNAVIFASANGLTRNWTIQNNQLHNCGTLDSDSGLMEIEMGASAGSTSVENIVVTGNSSNACYGPVFIFRGNSSATARTLSNLRVDYNTIQANVFTPIHINLSTFTSAHNISISNNEIDTVTGASQDGGIWLETTDTNNASLVRICNNIIRNTDNGALGAIFLDINNDVNNLTVDNNTIYTTQAVQAAIFAGIHGRWTSGSVSGNNIRSATNHGIKLECYADVMSSTGVVDVAICNNQLTSISNKGIYVYGALGATIPDLHSIMISNNTLDTITDNGIIVEAFSGTGLENLVINGNSIKDTGDTAILISQSGSVTGHNLTIQGNTIRGVTGSGIAYLGGLLMTGNFYGINITGNNVYDVSQHGIVTSTVLADLSGVVISNNHIHEWSQNVATAYYGAVTVASIGLSNASIAGNVAVTLTDYAIGYWLNPTGSSGPVSVTGNSASFTGSNTESLRFDSGASTTQNGLSITSNSFRGSVTGANFNASSFAPDRSICSLNVERTSGGAGNWAAFIVPFTNSVTSNNQS